MTDKKDDQPPKESHTILWVAVSVFVILAIAGMWAADYYYSPEMISPTSLPDAVGK